MHENNVSHTRTVLRAYAASKDRGPYINPYPPIDLRRVIITTHALKQFQERYTGSFTFFEVLSWSEEAQAIEPEWEIQRLMRHGTDARYFAFGPWRFVMTEKYEGKILLVITFEKKRVPPNPRKNTSRRERRRQRQIRRQDTMAW